MCKTSGKCQFCKTRLQKLTKIFVHENTSKTDSWWKFGVIWLALVIMKIWRKSEVKPPPSWKGINIELQGTRNPLSSTWFSQWLRLGECQNWLLHRRGPNTSLFTVISLGKFYRMSIQQSTIQTFPVLKINKKHHTSLFMSVWKNSERPQPISSEHVIWCHNLAM